MKYDNPMNRQVMSLPELIESQYEDLEPKTRTALTFQEIFNIQRIILTGCGDSFAACMAERYAFEMLAGIPAEAVPALELARYYDRNQLGVDCRNPLVIAVSNSGNVSRVAEAAARARECGAFVLGITGHADSALAMNSDKILELCIPPFESAPGTRSYMVSVMSLLLLAIRIGEVKLRYTMDKAMEMRFDILNQGKALSALLPGILDTCGELAERWRDFPYFEFAGGGYDFASAWFGHAKILEAVGRPSAAVSIEDWFHLNYFLRDIDGTGTFLCLNSTNPAMSRAGEFLDYAGEMGRPLAVATDSEEIKLPDGAVRIPVPKAVYPMTMPITQFVPFCVFAASLAEQLGEEYGRGSKGRWAGSAGGRGVNSSRIEIV